MFQVYFDEQASFDDWGITAASYVLREPEPKTIYIDLPAGDGQLDLTEALTKEVKYHPRELEVQFYIKPDHPHKELAINSIRSFLHGRVRTVRYEKEPEYYVTGRFDVSIEPDGVLDVVTITGQCHPWKYKHEVTEHQFNTMDSLSMEVHLWNSRKAVIPTFITDKELTVRFNNLSRTMSAGEHRFTSIYFNEGINDLTLEAAANTSIKIRYQEGWI
ncbi:hypothetical protein ACO1PF_00470 [Alkalibacterium sp. f15]|uniref:hypothetical protein n=1 Tax=Alkalibacterium sp. f15 TaxID=3414029 RepID=UPI003BF7DD26